MSESESQRNGVAGPELPVSGFAPAVTSGSKRNIVVIGASSGGVEALKSPSAALPSDFAATVFIVLHVGESSFLAEILDRAGPLPAANAVSGEKFKPGHIYVAPPGFHLLLHEDHMLLRRGPRENLARPAIDPLFRSAACSHGGAVIGIILSGGLSDGTAGLRAIKSTGGLAIVQDPADAAVPEMPLNASRHVEVDHSVSVADLPGLLVRLTGEEADESLPVSPAIRLEAAIAAQEHSGMKNQDRLGEISVFVCPECHGPLWEIDDGPLLRYRCHTGHAFTADAMVEAQASEAEQILWSLLRAHQQRADLARRMAEREKAHGQHAVAETLQKRSEEYEADARLVESLLANGQEVNAGNGASNAEGN